MDQHDLWLAEMCRTSYGRTPDYALGDARVHIFPMTGRKAVIFEGTKPDVLADVITDLMFLPFDDVTLGNCPSGFAANVRAVQYALIRDLYGEELELGGHSLGGATSAIMAAVFVAIGRPPKALTTFGCPNCCGENVRQLLSGVPGIGWWHGEDPVPDLPPIYRQPRVPTRFGARGWIDDSIEDHFIESYIKDGAAA